MANNQNQYPPPEGYALMGEGQQQGYPPAQRNLYPPIPPGPQGNIPYPPGPQGNVPYPPAPNNVIVQAPSAGGGGGAYQVPGVQPSPNCPPGLEYLMVVDQLIVNQKVELLEAFTGFETKNKYLIMNSLGQKVFYAGEESGCLSRNCCGNIRPFDMKILDNFGNQVMNLNRPLACQGCCFPCCLQTMEVTAPPGNVIGIVEQKWSIFVPTFAIKNAAGDTIFYIKGACCACRCCADVNFKVYANDGETEIGKITKKWSGIVKESLTDADNFGITFPVDLDVKMKATLLGALFLIDFMYFEENSAADN